MPLNIEAVQLIGVVFWPIDASILIYYIIRHRRQGGKWPTRLAWVTVAFCLAGSAYSGIRYIWGPEPWVFYAMSAVSTFMSVIVFLAVLAKLLSKEK